MQKYLKRIVPISNWLPLYTPQLAICDLIAGITVGLTLIPQSIAYASLAGLGPQYGLYSSLCGGFIYAIFGTVKDLNIAPTALVSLLTFTYTHDITYGAIHAAILLCFLTGIAEILCGVFRLGFLVDFVSRPVVVGFTTAGSLTIIASQLKSMLGLHFKAETFAKMIYQLGRHIEETKLADLYLGLGCCGFLLALREMKRLGKPPIFDGAKDTVKPHWFRTTLWFVSVARNAFVVVFCAVTAYYLKHHNMNPFSLTTPVPQALPKLTLPFVVSYGNQTYAFFEAAKELGTGIFVVPLVSILTNVALAKTFSNGAAVDASQEMLAMGLCNLFGSFVSSYPSMASFSRAAVNSASGAKTTFGGIYTGAIVLLAITFLTPYFSYIPKATLAAVIISALIFMLELNLSKLIWRLNKIDIFPLIITLIACLALSIEIGIIIGVCVDILLSLYYIARPKIEIEGYKNRQMVGYLQTKFIGSLIYSAAEYSREQILKVYRDTGGPDQYKYVVFDCSMLQKIDFTAANCLDSLVQDLSKYDTKIVFMGTKRNVNRILLGSVDKDCHFVNDAEDLDHFFEELEADKAGNVNEAFEEHELTDIVR